MSDKQIQTKDEDVGKKLQKAEGDLEVLAKRMALISNPYGRRNVIDTGTDQMEELKKSNRGLNGDDPYFKMLTLYEFDNGILLIQGFGEAYKTLATDMSKQLQKEFDCNTQGERATAHLVAQNYVRTLEIQKHISNILNGESYNDLRLKRLSILEKAYDRANNQYLLSIQTLKSIKQVPMNVIVKANTANIAQQQMIQENNEVKPK